MALIKVFLTKQLLIKSSAMETNVTKFLAVRWRVIIFFLFIASFAAGQNVPELMYYKFDVAGDQTNYASSPVGTNPALLVGLTTGSTGEFGTALVGNGGVSTTNNLNTGWATNLPNTGWTISFWLNNFPATSATTYYYFGDVNAASFRCFTGGVAGNGNLWVRGGGLTDTPINAIPSTPTVIHIVYTGSALLIYINGVYNSQVAQPSVTISGAGPFNVGGYDGSNSFSAGTLMDEWRLYNRALSAAEITATWNQPLPLGGPPICVTQAATGVTTTSATLNGTVNANGYSTTTSFKWGLTAAYGNIAAGAPLTITGNTAISITANLSGLLPGNTYHYCVCGVNSAGNNCGNDMTFTTPPVLPVVTTVAASPVFGSTATMNGTVNAGGASTAVTFEYGPTIAYGSTVTGVPATVTGNTTTPVSAVASGLSTNTLYHFRAKGVNSVGTVNGADMTFTTLNCNSPANPGAITGPANVCCGAYGVVYSVAAITYATGYIWTLPTGCVITSGNNTNVITVNFGCTSGNVTVTGSNSACGNGPTSTLAVTVGQVPVPTITGQSNLCVNSGYFDYYTQAGQSNYTWTISSGGTISSGAGTNHIIVTWNTAGAQTLSVNYTNSSGCSAANPTVLQVTVNPVPNAAGAISGTSSVCAGASGVAYSVGAVTNATSYVWTLPAGASVASGAGTNSITVDFSPTAVSGNILVAGNNACGNGPNSPAFPVTVSQGPGAAGAITGQASVCQGDNASYYITAVPNATGYTWSVPAGATIISGDNTIFIEVAFGNSASSGNVSVVPDNACGSGSASPNFAVTVNTTPPVPVITQNGSVLSSNAASGNQWYRNLVLIPGATYQHITPTEYGVYTDNVTLNGCASGMSNSIYYIPTGVGDNTASTLTVYPNPSDGQLTVEIPSTITGNYDILVFNSIGLKTMELKNLSGTLPRTLDLRPVKPGVYLVELQSTSTRLVTRIVIN